MSERLPRVTAKEVIRVVEGVVLRWPVPVGVTTSTKGHKGSEPLCPCTQGDTSPKSAKEYPSRCGSIYRGTQKRTKAIALLSS